MSAWLSVCSAPAPACKIIDAYSNRANTAATTSEASPEEELRAFQLKVSDRFPGLYAESVLGLRAGARQDSAVHVALAAARESHTSRQLAGRLRIEIDRATKMLAAFSDFHCDFPIYLADTLGQLDGAGRVVDGRHSLVLGVGNLDAEQSSISLSTFIMHEMFHRYHYQAAGYSDDLADKQPIWQVTWVEGLATYASQALTPGATVGEALMLPADLEQRAAPMLPSLVGDLLLHLDEVNTAVFTTYFTYGNQEVAHRGLPWRSGYYVGYLVAQDLARHHSLNALAHMKGRELHQQINDVLRQLAK
jgi:hypothetical protein